MDLRHRLCDTVSKPRRAASTNFHTQMTTASTRRGSRRSSLSPGLGLELDRRSSKKAAVLVSPILNLRKWYRVRSRVHSDDTCDIEFDDGDSEKRVELKRIKVWWWESV